MVRIIADSSCDLAAAVCQSKQIYTVPLNVTLEDGSVHPDGQMDLDEFYAHLVSCKHLPTTSQPSPSLFEQAYADAQQAGDDVVAITISSGVSGTYQSACIAAQLADYEDHIFIVDSQSISLGMGALVMYAADLRDKGKSAAEIASELERIKDHVHLFAMVNDLNNLRKGGRLNAAAAFTGGLLGVKPLLTVKDGKVTLIGKSRGLPGAYAAMFKHLDDFGGVCRELGCYAAYSDRAHQLDPILEFFKKNNYPIGGTGRIGTVVGTHVGAGAFGLAYFDASALPEL